jgi:hypothetical protein
MTGTFVSAVLLKIGIIMMGSYVVVMTGLVVTIGAAISQARKLAKLISQWGQLQGLLHGSHLMTGVPALKRRLLMVARQLLHLSLALGLPATIVGFQGYFGRAMREQGFRSPENDAHNGRRTPWTKFASVRARRVHNGKNPNIFSNSF